MTRRKLYEDMTRVTIILIKINSTLESAINEELTREDFLKQEKEFQELAGIGEVHPARKTTLLPFVETFTKEMAAWISSKKNGGTLLHFVNILRGNQLHISEGKLSAASASSGKDIPSWYLQTLDIGKTILEKGTAAIDKLPDKVAALQRNIPVDATLGLVAHSFLKGILQLPPGDPQIQKWWLYLNGKEPLAYKVKIKGTYVWTEF